MTLYFQMQFLKVHCTFNARSEKCSLKKERLSAKRQRDMNAKKNHDYRKEKKQGVKKRYGD